MTDDVVQTNIIVLLGDDFSNGSKKCPKTPIQQDVPMNDNTLVREETCGDELVLGAIQPKDSWIDGDETNVASDGSHHLETVITKIAQLPL